LADFRNWKDQQLLADLPTKRELLLCSDSRMKMVKLLSVDFPLLSGIVFLQYFLMLNFYCCQE
jgi:hypothetical protein